MCQKKYQDFVCYQKLLTGHLTMAPVYETAILAWSFEETSIKAELSDEKQLIKLTQQLQTDIDEARKSSLNLESLFSAQLALPSPFLEAVQRLKSENDAFQVAFWFEFIVYVALLLHLCCSSISLTHGLTGL